MWDLFILCSDPDEIISETLDAFMNQILMPLWLLRNSGSLERKRCSFDVPKGEIE